MIETPSFVDLVIKFVAWCPVKRCKLVRLLALLQYPVLEFDLVFLSGSSDCGFHKAPFASPFRESNTLRIPRYLRAAKKCSGKCLLENFFQMLWKRLHYLTASRNSDSLHESVDKISNYQYGWYTFHYISSVSVCCRIRLYVPFFCDFGRWWCKICRLTCNDKSIVSSAITTRRSHFFEIWKEVVPTNSSNL